MTRLLCVLSFLSGSLLAQSTTQQISGFVRDASGAAVTGVTVSLRSNATGQVRTAVANETGYYVIANVAIGDYEISAESQGFKKFIQKGVVVTVNSKPSVDINLEVGTLTESVTVSADAAQVEASTGEIGRLVTEQQATQLQLNGRNFAQLLALLPGVSTTYRSSFDLFGGFGSNMSSQSVNGGRTTSFSWNIDGADNKDNGGGGNNFVNINPDAIAEFKVLTSNYSAEYGQNAGAVINLALKSGTQQFQGGAYEFVRNDAFDARAFNAVTKQKLRFNNFGWNLGGPIYVPGWFNRGKDKLFFFMGMEFKRLNRGNVNIWNVPTLAMRNGDFTAPGTGSAPTDPLAGNAPFPGRIVPMSRFSRNAKRLVDLYPAPNFTGTGGNLNFFTPDGLNANQYIYKVDYNLSERHQIAVHYLRDYYTSLQQTTNTATYNRNIPGTNSSAKWTWVKSPSSVNTFQFTFTGNVIRQVNFQPNPLFVRDYSRNGNGIDYPMVYGNETSIPSISIAGFNALSTTPRQWNNFNRVFQFKDDFSKVISGHSLKLGVLAMRSRKNQDNQPAINGAVNFANGHPLDSSNPAAAALLGNFNTYTEASAGREGWFRFTQVEFYLQDNWKVSSRLTLDLGARYHLMQPQYASLQNATVFSPRFFDPALAPQIDAAGQIVPGTGDLVNGLVAGGTGLPDFAASRISNASDPLVRRVYRGLPKEISPWDYGTLGPRFGFAYDVTGRQNTVVRGGYGLLFERVQGNLVFGRVNNPPFIQEASLFSANLENPSGGTQRIFPSNVTGFDIDLRVPKVNNWSLGVQHKLFRDTLLDVAYVGSSGWHQYRSLNLNQLRAGAIQRSPGVNVQRLRPYLGYANLNTNFTSSNFNYHSLQAQFKKQFSRAGLFNVAYTWSKAITDASDWNEGPQDSYDFKAERALASYDRRHVAIVSYIYPLPFWQAGTDAWFKRMLGGWQLSGVTTLQSGRPLNLGVPGDRAGIGQGGQRPNLIGDWRAGAGTSFRWFNPAAFADAPLGTFGNLGRNAVTGPGTNNWDISLQKVFRFNERFTADFRAEFYNAPHHFSYFGVATTTGANNFGQVTSASDPRPLQFGLKLAF